MKQFLYREDAILVWVKQEHKHSDYLNSVRGNASLSLLKRLVMCVIKASSEHICIHCARECEALRYEPRTGAWWRRM